MASDSGIPVPNALAEGDALQSTVAAGTAASFSTTIKFSGPPEAAKLQFSLVCTNIPAGSQVALHAAAPNGSGPGFRPINLPWSFVPVPVGGKSGDRVPSFSVGITTQVDANYQTDITYEYQSNGYPPPPGLSVTMQVLLLSSGNDYTLTSGDYDDDPFGPDDGGGTMIIIGTHTTVLPDQD